MANKYTFDLELNTKGYTDGVKAAEDSNADFVSSIGDVNKTLPNLRKELGASRKETASLALAYKKLSDQEKNSGFGKALAKSLEESKKKTAELLDMNMDLQRELKNMASDTATWDALKEGMDVAKSATVAFATSVGELTGNEKELAELIKKITQIESTFNTVIKLGNALQKQSAVILGIKKIQTLAAAKATQLEASATKGATIAQKAFNAVAKANPYVLLATVAIAAATAIGAYMLATKKNTKAEEEAAQKTKALKDAREKYISTMSTTFGNLMGTYNELRLSWKKLSSEHEKVEWIKKNKTKLDELGLSIKNVKDAEKVFNTNTSSVIDSFRKRAEAAALAAQAVQLYAKSLEIEQQATDKYNSIRKKTGDKATANDFNEGRATYNNRTGEYEYTEKGAAEVNKQLWEQDATLKKLRADYSEIQDQIDANVKKQEQLSKTIKSTETTASKETTENKKVKFETGVELSDKVGKQIRQDLNKKVKEINEKGKAGIEKVKVDMKLTEDSLDLSDLGNTWAKIENLKMPDLSYDFKNLPEQTQKLADDGVKNLDRLSEAMAEAGKARDKFMQEGNTEGVEQMDEQITSLTEKFNQQKEALDGYQEKANQIGNLSKAFNDIGSVVGTLGSTFSQLGDSLEDPALKIMGIIGEAVATVALSFAKALTTCATWVDWLAFGVTGMATMISLITQIKQVTAGSFATGGIVPGSSYYGDKLTANVSSGEMILNRRQQKNLFDAIDNNKLGSVTSNRVEVTGIIRGKDLLLVQKNYNSFAAKSGQNIYIN